MPAGTSTVDPSDTAQAHFSRVRLLVPANEWAVMSSLQVFQAFQ
jgi:hypothetical protein